MDNTKPNAARCMRAWREAQVPKLTQRGLAAQMKGAPQSQIALWEKEDAPERPDLARALELQAISRGEVPAPLWGYTTEEIERVLAAAAFQPMREGIGHTSSDFAGPRDSIVDAGV
jgi:hypothetical protein